MNRLWVKIVATGVLIAGALVLVRMHRASGAVSADAPRGRELARAWCLECHAENAATSRPLQTAPDFRSVANLPSTTALSLAVFLRSSHPTMPNVILQPSEQDAIIQYILSLKSR